MTSRWGKSIAILVVLIGISGCSGSPTDPGLENIPELEIRGIESSRTGPFLWSIWDVQLDPGDGILDVIPDRGTLFTCNVTHFVAGPPVGMSAEIIDLDIQADFINVILDINLTNPFDHENFPGFDVIGVFMGNGTDVIPDSGGLNVQGENDQLLLNPDGYTRWFNYPEFAGAGSIWEMFGYNAIDSGPSSFFPNARVCPYKYYADGLDTEQEPFDYLCENEISRGSFAPDAINTRRHDLRFPVADGASFKYAVIAHWKKNVNAPDPPGSLLDFPPDANSDEALIIDVVDESTAYFIDETENGGNVRLNISVWDWSAELTSTVIEEYEIRCYSDFWDDPYAVDMTPTFSAQRYFTFKTAIPVSDLQSLDPIPLWIGISYPGLDYANDFGVSNDATGPLTSWFYTEAIVNDFMPVWINVIQPNGGELLEVGKDFEINWESENLSGNIFIMFSLDDFVTDFHPVAVNEPNDGVFLWEDIPDMPSETVKLRVSSMMNSDVNDRSDGYFTIYDSTEPFIRVTSPNGGELWKSSTAREIKWISKNVVGNIYIEYSKDDFTSDFNIIGIDIENLGSYLWEDIPYDLSETCLVRITSMLDPGISDISDDYFTIDNPPIEVLTPDGGEEWKAGSTQEIIWETIDFESSLLIEYSKDYFVSDINVIAGDIADTGSFMWENIPNDPSTTVRVRISSTDDPGVRDISDANFSIEESGWGISFGGENNDIGYEIELDDDGNIFVTGTFRDMYVDFDPDPESTDLHSSNGGMDVFLSKFNSLGQFEWARTWGGPYYDRGYGLAVDPDGNALVTGFFRGTSVDFDPGEGIGETDLHTAVGSYDVFVSKFNPSGDYLWTKTFGGTGEENGFDVDTDQFGNVYLTGSFRGFCDFDPGVGSDSHQSGGTSDVYLISLDSSGEYIWGQSWGGDLFIDGYDQGYALTVGEFGDIYVTGNLAGEDIDLDPDPDEEAYVTVLDGCDAFISKFDLSGNFDWGGIWGGYLNDSGLGITTDADGNVFVTGRFEGMVDFDPGAGAEVYISEGEGYDAFLTKFDLLGGHHWARTWGGEDFSDYGWSVGIGGIDTVYVIGNFEGTVDFDPGVGIQEYTALGGNDFFLSSFNTSGWFNWARVWGGDTVMEYGHGVWPDSNGNAFICGGITGTGVDFDPGEGIDPRNTYNADVYIIKVMPDGEW